jgi:DNA-binding Xre family transcriptional regulator
MGFRYKKMAAKGDVMTAAGSVVDGRSRERDSGGRDERGLMAWSVNVDLLDRERVLRGWTQRQLALSARVDPGTLSDLLGRRRRPKFGTVQAVCTALNLTLAEVISFAADVKPERSAAS